MLEKFRQAKMSEIRELEANGIPAPFSGTRPSFSSSIRQPNQICIIAEYKRASPSRGIIRQDLTVEDVARLYTASGAAALSILTEKMFFDGHISYLERAFNATGGQTAILRKDFLFHKAQIAVTAATPASALLLIARMFTDARNLREMREFAASFGMEAVVEIFDKNDLKMAREAGAEIIQVNARDLDTLKVDRESCLRIIREHPPQTFETWIAASGISSRNHLQAAQSVGYHAALIGSSLMSTDNPGKALQTLIGGQ